MEKISITNARSELPEIVNRAYYGGQRTIIQKQKKDCVAIIPIRDLEILQWIEDLIDIRDAEKAILEAKEKGIRSFDELAEELGLK